MCLCPVSFPPHLPRVDIRPGRVGSAFDCSLKLNTSQTWVCFRVTSRGLLRMWKLRHTSRTQTQLPGLGPGNLHLCSCPQVIVIHLVPGPSMHVGVPQWGSLWPASSSWFPHSLTQSPNSRSLSPALGRLSLHLSSFLEFLASPQQQHWLWSHGSNLG